MKPVILLLICLLCNQAYGSEQASQKQYGVTLNDGTSVELLGLRYYGHRDLERYKGKDWPWWRPDGSSLEGPPDKRTDLSSCSDSYLFVVRINGTGDYSCKTVGPWGEDLNVQTVNSKGEGSENADLRRFILRFSPGQKEANIRLGLATDKWKVVENWPFWERATPESSLFESNEEVIMRCPEQKGTDIAAEVTQTILDEATRLVMFDRDGDRHEPKREYGGRSAGLIRYIYRFENLHRNKIERIEFQKRPYDYWITFNNVSLCPRQETKVEVQVEKAGALLPGQGLPTFDNIKIDFNSENSKGKAILFCFFDMEQRPSRHYIQELAKQAEQLGQKGVTVVAVQASKVDKSTLDECLQKRNISFPVGMIEGDEEKTRFNWGVKSLPWLILTDRKHIVQSNGFTLSELDEKLKQISGEQ